MENDRIENNSTYQKFKKELEGAAALHKLIKFFSFFGLERRGLNEAFEKLPDLRKQVEKLAKAPDKFNDHFSKKGFIAFESMSSELMEKSSALADEGKEDEAVQGLINHYVSPEIKWQVRWLNATPAFRQRQHLIQLAFEDTLAERYHAAVLVLLTVIDGGVNDISKSKGFFADNTDLTAWDSMAAHSTGLSVLKVIFSQNRKQTTLDEIDLPLRNGILHGRDLGFANKAVTAKCWAALFAINDWAKAINEGKKNPPPQEPKPTFRESFGELKAALENYNKVKQRNKEVDKKVKAWKPRHITPGVDIPASGSSNDYVDYSPEKAAAQFCENWTKNNFGAIARQIHRFSKEAVNFNKVAGRVREVFSGKKLVGYSIIKVVDCSPCISEIILQVTFIHNEATFEKEIKLRMIYEDQNGRNLIIGELNGSWTFIESFFHTIQFPSLSGL